ncbi:hypothetical protein ABH942_003007 [Flavobacterium sp. 28YEA47A]|uniref:hypothetical protein n=1 Tax=Flavobacterium sp. 28YEA47A TaxID=3156276 RepID=UPI003515361E
MKKHILKFSDIYVIIITVIIATGIHCFIDKKTEILIAIYTAGISIAFSIRQYRIENDKIFKELFIMYNEKYDLKFNNCLNIIVKKASNQTYELIDEEKPLIIDYLNMCSEQYLWFTKGRIDSIAWKSWEKGMKFYLECQPIKNFISKESQKDSYYGIFEYLKL